VGTLKDHLDDRVERPVEGDLLALHALAGSAASFAAFSSSSEFIGRRSVELTWKRSCFHRGIPTARRAIALGADWAARPVKIERRRRARGDRSSAFRRERSHSEEPIAPPSNAAPKYMAAFG
jgi:hypothetical protein